MLASLRVSACVSRLVVIRSCVEGMGNGVSNINRDGCSDVRVEVISDRDGGGKGVRGDIREKHAGLGAWAFPMQLTERPFPYQSME